MSTIHIILLALIQGFTEFLPISSSAHLILPSYLLGFKDQGLAFDIATHIGSLVAVIIYFRSDLKNMLIDFFKSILTKKSTSNSRLAWWIILATIPTVIVGFMLKNFINEYLRSVAIIASTTIIFGLLLGYADKKALFKINIEQVGYKRAFLIGCAQVIALIPGVSRSGITITAGLFLGLTREAAARLSFLMSIPTILGAAILLGHDIIKNKIAVDWYAFSLGTFISFISAYACIFCFLKLINKMGMFPFVVYRVILGIVLFCLIFYGYK